MLPKLRDYGVSRSSGFVPESPSELLDEHYRAWEDIAADLPKLLHEERLWQAIKTVPSLNMKYLRNEPEWQRAYVLLAFIVHALIHGCKQSAVPNKIATPFLQICDHLGLQPVITYSGLCLFNSSRSGKQGVLGGLKSIVTFTGTIDEEAFYLVPVLVELRGGRLPKQLLSAHCAAQKGSWQDVADQLEKCHDALLGMVEALNELSICKPNTFYHNIRPYIAGIEVEFEKTSAESVSVKLVGGSAGQASLFQFLDHMLGVRHETTMLEEMRAYMPRGHRDFLNDIQLLPSLHDLAVSSGAPTDIFDRLGRCRLTLKMWRDKHIAIVARYVMLPARAAERTSTVKSEVKGTAGSSPVTFLKQLRNETMAVQV